MAVWSPTGIRIFDVWVRGIFAACLLNISISAYILDMYPTPIASSLRIVRYLMEEDGTACKQQNTKQNRALKQAQNG